MQLKVLYFAALRDVVGRSEELVEATGCERVAELVSLLERRHPALRLDGVRVARNLEFVDDREALAEGDEIALIPPVSGG